MLILFLIKESVFPCSVKNAAIINLFGNINKEKENEIKG